MVDSRYVTAEEAAGQLGIRRATLYAYVSRGLIRSEPAPGDSRARRYYREDIEKLKRRKAVRRDPGTSGEQALHWGTPVLESALTLIDDGRLYYRGRDALQLAQSASFEAVVALLWAGDSTESDALFGTAGDVVRPAAADLSRLTAMERFQVMLPLAATEDVAGYDLRPNAVRSTGARILTLLTLIAADISTRSDSIAKTLQAAWMSNNHAATDLINMALILCADHELNVSSFTARCVASAGASPYAVVQAGLAALSGVKHGGSSARAEALLREAGTPEQARPTVASRLRRGDRIPGFGHRLYPDGDPRAELLLTRIRERYTTSLTDAVIEAARESLGEKPNIDMALATLAHALELPAGGAVTLFALGRTAGWIAHAIEQYQQDELIRPRARYVGEMPSKMKAT